VKSNVKKCKTKGIVISAVIGVVVAMFFMAIFIYFGYCTAYRSNVDSMNVSVFGLDIYSLTLVGDEYRGSSIGQNMEIICIIFVAIAICLEQVITRLLSKR
jgi:hypothetical protein